MAVAVLKLTNELIAFDLTKISKMVIVDGNITFDHDGNRYTTDKNKSNMRFLGIHPDIIGDKEHDDDPGVVNFWNAYVSQ